MLLTHLNYSIIQPSWKVLQVGGAMQPFRRADCVIDRFRYDERSKTNQWFITYPQHFDEETWFPYDPSTITWPFEDEEFDYVICADVLNSFRDPVHICNEMERVGKRGYIEIPSIWFSLLEGVQREGMVGSGEHRWLADLDENDSLRFIHKFHQIHFMPEYHLKTSNKHPHMNPLQAKRCLFWNEKIDSYEDFETGDFPDWFLEEKLDEYNGKTATEESYNRFWDVTTPVPVLLKEDVTPFKNDGFTQLSLDDVKFSVPMYKKEGGPNMEILKYQALLDRKTNE